VLRAARRGAGDGGVGIGGARIAETVAGA
jgi:hypothetical protein